MAKKKRPSLKDFLSTGQVIAEEIKEQPLPLEEAQEASPAREPAATKKTAAKARRPRSAPAKPPKTAPGEGEESSAGKDAAVVREVRETDAASSGASSEKCADDEAAAPLEVEAVPDSGSAPRPERSEALREFVDLLCDEDRRTWEKIFAVARAEFLPLDFIERREDFRTMDRSRFTLFRLEEAGTPLFHVRTSVQIREPLLALLKWDETGTATIYRP